MDAISPYIRKLQEGYFANCPYYGGNVFVCGGIGEINADMPQANHCANCLSSTANKRLDSALLLWPFGLLDYV